MTDDDRIISVATRFRMVREDCGLSQREVAEKCNLSRNTVSHLENHEDIKLSTLLELSATLNVPPHLWFVPDAEWLLWYYRTYGAAP